MTDKRNVTVRFDEATHERITAEATAEKRSVANYLELLILTARAERALAAARDKPSSRSVLAKEPANPVLQNHGRRLDVVSKRR